MESGPNQGQGQQRAPVTPRKDVRAETRIVDGAEPPLSQEGAARIVGVGQGVDGGACGVALGRMAERVHFGASGGAGGPNSLR